MKGSEAQNLAHHSGEVLLPFPLPRVCRQGLELCVPWQVHHPHPRIETHQGSFRAVSKESR